MGQPSSEKAKPIRRKCGDCAGCCTVLAVPTIEKERYVECSKLKPGNRRCSIYDSRPGECGSWTCAWLQGLGQTSQRPDRIGVVFSTQMTILGSTLVGMEIRKGCARDNGEAARLGKFVAERMNLGLIMGGKDWRKILRCPPGKELEVKLAMSKYQLKVAEDGRVPLEDGIDIGQAQEVDGARSGSVEG